MLDTQNINTRLEQIKQKFPENAIVKRQSWMDDILQKESFSDEQIRSTPWIISEVYERGQDKKNLINIKWEYGIRSYIGSQSTPEELIVCNTNGEPLEFDKEKPTIIPIGHQIWTNEGKFNLEIPIYNADTAWVEGNLHTTVRHSWDQEKSILTITGDFTSQDVRISYPATIFAKKGDNQVECAFIMTSYYLRIKLDFSNYVLPSEIRATP